MTAPPHTPGLTVTLAHVAAGANAVTGALDWGAPGRLRGDGGGRAATSTPAPDHHQHPDHDADAPLAFAATRPAPWSNSRTEAAAA